jgi:hypothetical protein
MIYSVLYNLIMFMGLLLIFVIILGLIYVYGFSDKMVSVHRLSNQDDIEIHYNRGIVIRLNTDIDPNSTVCVTRMINENRGYSTFEELNCALNMFTYSTCNDAVEVQCKQNPLTMVMLKQILTISPNNVGEMFTYSDAKLLYDKLCSEYYKHDDIIVNRSLIWHICMANITEAK